MSEKRKQSGEQMLVRFPEGSDLRSRLEVAAKANNRSVTAEIMQRLAVSFSSEEDWVTLTQRSPTMRAERKIIAAEARLIERIESLEERIAAIEARKNS
ncbi:Arc family DNA-binding protein [Frigidibacter oleivorans]|uniref:Arc family DNA-binding protein n=1 Tax=Frigidibacter oleivorans TaxID=2487129 RepID=UPI000F8D6246|nr:Arc family DNA-binding protein [Frigidibacter oleivorans]